MIPREWDGGYHGMVAYGQAKSANILFSVYLMEHLNTQGILASVFTQGVGLLTIAKREEEDLTGCLAILTGLTREFSAEILRDITERPSSDWKTLDQGAATSVVAAFSPKLDSKLKTSLIRRNCGLKAFNH